MRSLLLVLLVFLPACRSVVPTPKEDVRPLANGMFDYQDYEAVLRDYVNEKGQVDYGAMQRNTKDFDRFLVLLAAYSPDSAPEVFKTPNDALAYWINAYNACVLKGVRDHFPVAFIDKISGFSTKLRYVLGKKPYTLEDIRMILQTRFKEPRIAFALTDGTDGGPRLEQKIYDPKFLNQQLDKATKRFLRNREHIYIEKKKMYLSSYLQLSEPMILAALRAKGVPNPTLLEFIGKFVTFPNTIQAGDIRFFDSDASINDTPLFTDPKLQLPY